jgi:tRNA-dihydrouridine synthase A
MKDCRHPIAIAPMMEWTDRHCRVFHRTLTRRALLHTEMIVADGILRGDRERLLRYSQEEHPLALQLGGNDPAKVAAAARIAADCGYDEINLNVGCPSDRVRSGTFGACLMREPALVGDVVAAMRAAVSVPITVKCRLGVDEQDPEVALPALAEAVFAAGADGLWVHARKAWLAGLSPKENREVPPLDHALVRALKRAMPGRFIGINGGIASLDEAAAHLADVDGVMLGRAAYHNPAVLADIDRRFYGDPETPADQAEAVLAMLPYVARETAAGTPLAAITRHMLGLFQGRPGARLWRQMLSVDARSPGAGTALLETALLAVTGIAAQMPPPRPIPQPEPVPA